MEVQRLKTYIEVLQNAMNSLTELYNIDLITAVLCQINDNVVFLHKTCKIRA